MKRCLITGGAEFLSNQGHEVTVLNSSRIGFSKNIDSLNVQFVKGDIRDKDLVKDLTKNTNAICHLVALGSVPESLTQISECVEINTIDTLTIVEAARETKNCKVIFSTSAANYGDIKHSQENPEKFNKLGFKPRYTIQDALEETIMFYHKELLIK